MNQAQVKLTESYTHEHHLVWKKLNAQQRKINRRYSATEYIEGFDALRLNNPKIQYLNDLNERLGAIADWQLVLVPGLVPVKEFFQLLIKKQYPITVYVRSIRELEYSESPDKFHDIYGHVPLLANKKFNQFLSDFSEMALRYIDNEKAVEYLGNFYWYTFEMGLIREEHGFKAYGGAIITSMSEALNVKSVLKRRFNVRDMLRTEIDISSLQKQYFYINSFNELFDSLQEVEKYLHKLTQKVEVSV